MNSSNMTATTGLLNDEFDAAAFTKQLVYNSSIDSIKQQLLNFQQTKSTLTFDLQRNFFSNYSEFIKISNQISLLDKDLLELKNVIGQFHSVALSEYSTMGDDSLDSMEFYSAEEGRKKLDVLQSQIPELEEFNDKQLLRDGINFAIVHPTDPSLAKNVHLLLFHDVLIIGNRRKKGISKPKTTIEHKIHLYSLSVVDIHSPDNPHSFKLIFPSESLVLCAQDAETKKNWILALRKCADESKRTNILPANLGTIPSDSRNIFISSLNDLPAMTIQTLSKQDCVNPDILWIHDMPDLLDVCIAHREFDTSIQYVERANGILSSYSDSTTVQQFRKQLESRVEILSGILCRDLEQKSNAKTIFRLCKLGFSSRASEIFLKSQARVIHSALASVLHEGNTVLYIHDLTYLFFSLLKKTIRFYRQFFSDYGLYSALLLWVNGELEFYWNKFRNEVFHEDQTFDVIGECLSAAREGCSILKDIGVDIGHVFETNAVRADVVVSLEWLRTKISAEIAKAIADDEFTACVKSKMMCFEVISADQDTKSKIVVDDSMISISASIFKHQVCKFLFFDLFTLLAPSSSHTYYNEVTESVITFFEMFFRHVLNLSHDPDFLDRQLVIAVWSLSHLSESLFRSLISLMENSGNIILEPNEKSEKSGIIGFKRPVHEWTKAKQRVDAMTAVLLSSFILKRTRGLARQSFAFGRYCVGGQNTGSEKVSFIDYTNDAYPVLEKLCPNDSMIQMIKKLKEIEENLQDTFNEGPSSSSSFNVTSIMKEIITCFLKDMSHESNWKTVHGYDIVFGYSGLHQFILDLHFMMKLADVYLTAIARKYGDDLCGKALKLYFKRCNDEQKKRVLKSGEFFDRRVIEILKQPSTGLTKLGISPKLEIKQTK